jgi:hypothetical protein
VKQKIKNKKKNCYLRWDDDSFVGGALLVEGGGQQLFALQQTKTHVR